MSIVTVQTQAIPNVVELPGRIQAIRTSEVRARVDGIVEARLYEEGSDVAAGKALFQIDPRQLRASSSAVQAQLVPRASNRRQCRAGGQSLQGIDRRPGDQQAGI